MKQINTLAIFLMLIFIAVSSGCRTAKIDAQTPTNPKPVVAKNEGANNSENSKTTYQPPKRISKDILK